MYNSTFSFDIFCSKRRFFLATASAAAIILASAISASANEWTGAAGNDDFFNPLNWSDGNGPQGQDSTVNSGAPVGVIDLGSGSSGSNAAANIGTAVGADASVRINILTIPDYEYNSTYLTFGEDVRVGSGGGNGSLTLSTDGNVNSSLYLQRLLIGDGADSVGTVNLLGTGKDIAVSPEGPYFLDSQCYACAPIFVTPGISGGLHIGTGGGTGTLNIDGSVYTYLSRGDFIVGNGIGSRGTLNVLAGGKLGDSQPYGFNPNPPTTVTGGQITVGLNGGSGIVNIDGSLASTRDDAPIALLSHGLVVGQGQNSTGEFNILSKGKVHSYLPQSFLDDSSISSREEFETRLGVDGGTGLISVSGAGSVWYQSGVFQQGYNEELLTTDSGTIRVGETGIGELNLFDSGIIRVGSATVSHKADPDTGKAPYELIDYAADGTLVLGDKSSGKGTLSIGGKEGSEAASPGRLMAKIIEFGEGEGKILFNHTQNGYVFDKFEDQFMSGPTRSGGIQFEGTGAIEAISGRTLLVNDHLDFQGELIARGEGILQVNGDMHSTTATVFPGGTLEGSGIVGSTTNSGIIAPGETPEGNQSKLSSIGTLTISGNYVGQNGLLSLDTQLGDDTSLTDKLVISGDTSGKTSVVVTNIGGAGAQTVEGIRVVEVGGTSAGTFDLLGNYVHDGQQAVVAGAYAYKLYQGGVSTPTDGDWYLRSQLKSVDPIDPIDPIDPVDPNPLYQAGVPLYEAYPQALLGLNGVSTLQQRVGNRYWTGNGNRVIAQGADPIGSDYASMQEAGGAVDGNGVWGRIEGSHNRMQPGVSTSGTDYNQNVFRMQAGLDGVLSESGAGKLIGGVTVHYAHGKTNVGSAHGDGNISTDGYGFGSTLTWYGENGLYLDGQGQLTWYRSDLYSDTARRGMTDNNHGFGYALSLEGGKRIGINDGWAITPQAQLVYSNVDFDSFLDVFGSDISLDRGRSLQGRLGVTLEHENSWQNANGMLDRARVYGIANIYHEFLNGTRVNVVETHFTSRNDRTWGGLGFGGTYSWNDDKYSIYGEGLVKTSLNSFADSYSVNGNVGFRVKW